MIKIGFLFIINSLVFADTLLQFQAVSRHGVRSYTSANQLPNLPCVKLKSNYGQVTDLGRLQNYKSGKDIRATSIYASLFAEGYHPDWHYFFSTDEDKTLQSAQSVFQGMFDDCSNYPTSQNYSTEDGYSAPVFFFFFYMLISFSAICWFCSCSSISI
jgi:hypothetical protein